MIFRAILAVCLTESGTLEMLVYCILHLHRTAALLLFRGSGPLGFTCCPTPLLRCAAASRINR